MDQGHIHLAIISTTTTGLGEDRWMARWDTRSGQSVMSLFAPIACNSPQTMEIRTSQTPSGCIHWSGACELHLWGLLSYPVDMTHTRWQAEWWWRGDISHHMSLPEMKISAGLVWSLVMSRPSPYLTLRWAACMTTEVNGIIALKKHTLRLGSFHPWRW